jgi:hypothetical protein
MLRILKAMALVVALAAVTATPAGAQCSGPLTFGHLFQTGLVNCADDGPVTGFVYALTATLQNTGNSDIVCEEDGGPSQGALGCAGSGTLGDGNVYIDGNWANPGVFPTGAAGCPNTDHLAGVGRNVAIVRDTRGGTVVLSAGFDPGNDGYQYENAHKSAGQLSCRTPDGLSSASQCVSLVGAVNRTGDATTTNVNATMRTVPPRVFTDCDSDSAGIVFGTGSCTEGEGALATHFTEGNIYSRMGRCDGSDLSFARSAWTPEVMVGNTASFTRSFPSDLCLFVGSSMRAATVEGPGIVCATAIAGNLAASPRALAVRAKQDKGDVVIEFRTDTEVGLNGFEIETKSGRKVVDLIDATGIGGAGTSYTVRVKRGDFRSEKEFYVVSVTDNARIKSDLASF